MIGFRYLGGGGADNGYAIALDTQNNVFVTGITDSSDFPIIDAPQPKRRGAQDAFVSKISSDGKKLLYSTYLGGTTAEWGYAIAPASNGDLISAGETFSTDFPIEAAIQTTNATKRTVRPPSDAYITKLSPIIQPPLLKIARSGGNIILTWSTNFVGFSIQMAQASPSPSVWNNLPVQSFIIGGQNTIVQKAFDTSVFYRLSRR